jgi:ABC-2 type transport system ATP-binding protein
LASEIRIEAAGLVKKFDDFLAVDGINLKIKAGEILVLLGPNGAGKTTTIRMLTSILRPTQGWARVNGYDVIEHPDKVRASVGVLTEHHGLYNRMKAMEYLVYFGQLYGLNISRCRERAAQLLEQFGLSDAYTKRLGEFSKGMRQKLALVRALLHEPPVILLDEPTSAMDPESARTVRQAIHSLRNADRSMIICTHNLAEAEELADQIAIIRRGKIILSGRLDEIRQALLGNPEYEITFSDKLDGRMASVFKDVKESGRGQTWVRYVTSTPEVDNPKIIQRLVQGKYSIVRVQPVVQSLEDIYLQTVTTEEFRS